MLNRRLFLTQLLSSTPLTFSPRERLGRGSHARSCGRDVLVPPEHVLTLRSRPSVPEQHISSSRRRQDTDNANRQTLLKSYQRVCKQASPRLLHRLRGNPWQLSEEKLNVLIRVTDLLANAYPMANRKDWLEGLIWRENLGTTAFGGGDGIVHQFQGFERGIPLRTRHPQGDCWVFLAPEGVEYDAFDDQPVYVLFAIVLPQQNAVIHPPCFRRGLELAMIERIWPVIREVASSEIDWQWISGRDTSEVSGLLNLFDTASSSASKWNCV